MIESIVGTTFVLLDGWKRSNEPVRGDSGLDLDSRSSTTALSYFGASPNPPRQSTALTL